MGAAYRLTADPAWVLRVADNTLIPVGEPTQDSRDYQRWLDAGNTPDPAP